MSRPSCPALTPCVFPLGPQNLTNEEQVVVIQARTVLTLAEKVIVTEWTLLGGVRLPAGPRLLSPGKGSSQGEGPREGGVGRLPALSSLGGLARTRVGHTAAAMRVCKRQTQPGLALRQLSLFPPQRLGDAGVP